MIRSNNRKLGTIRTTPAKKYHKSVVSDQNNMKQDSFNNSIVFNDYALSNKIRNLQQTAKNTSSNIISNKDESTLLDLACRSIIDLQNHIDSSLQLQHIHTLNISGNNISSFPHTIFNKLFNMCELYLEHNSIAKISFPYFKENKLKIVNISNNQLVSLNLEHLERMVSLDCCSNKLTFLTLPQSIKKINCSNNNISNIYFLQHCKLLEEVHLNNNMLYDLKLSFKPFLKQLKVYSKQRDQPVQYQEIRYKYLHYLDCSNNKIQYLDGLISIFNIKILILNSNRLSVTRNVINQLILLQNLEEISLINNPLEEGGFTQFEIYQTLHCKISSLKHLNGQNIKDHTMQKEYSSSKKSQFSGIMDEPYQLFLQNQVKDGLYQKGRNMQWNFTLGDCENESNRQSKINQLSLIQQLHNVSSNELGMTKSLFEQNNKKQSTHIAIQDQNHPPKVKEKNMKMKIIKSDSPLAIPHHIHYQPYLKQILSMSYIPASPVLKGSSKVTSRRLDEQDDDYMVISKMFLTRGGVVYIKKVSAWLTSQNDEQIYSRHHFSNNKSSMGFLLNQISQKQFKLQYTSNKLLPRQPKDIIGMQPNVFSCFHRIVRFNPHQTNEQYLCIYFVQSAHY